MRGAHLVAGAALLSLLGGCAVGPSYHRPDAAAPPRFKEAAGWTPGEPADAIDKGSWWSMFHDDELDRLEQQVAVANQTVRQYEAAFRQAHELVAHDRASLFPNLGADAGASRGLESASNASVGGAAAGTPAVRTSYTAELDASWIPDLWGSQRRTIASDKAQEQASTADLANARLAAQGTLAQDYFALRTLDAQTALYRDTVTDYEKFLTLTTNQYNEGRQTRAAVITAETQLDGAQAALIELGVKRSAMEHAIAVLVGVPPAALTIMPGALSRAVPVTPVAVPADVLQRRPDIAAAERRVAAANAQIGVAVAAYYPELSLSGEYGKGATSLGKLFDAGSTLWSAGAELAGTLFDFGAHRAQVRISRAAYDETVANYRQTVLSAFQGVEDQLSALHLYQEEQAVLLRTEAAAQQAVRLDLNQYREGTIDFTTVITAQTTAATTAQNVLTVLQERLQASVLLVEDLGGEWSAQELPR